MLELLTGTLLLSLLHATIPNHWAPVLAVARAERWPLGRAVGLTAVAGLAHVLSTVGLGLALGLLVGIGLLYALSGPGHAHPEPAPARRPRQLVLGLALTMFLAPCLEIQTFFLTAGTRGPAALALLMAVYLVVTVAALVAVGLAGFFMDW